MSKRNLFVRAGLLTGLFVLNLVPSQAQEIGRLRQYDANGDSAISVAEAETAYKAMFGELDANHDGTISQKEFVDAHLAQLSKLDSNHDGKVDRSEMRDAIRARLGR